MKQMRFLGFYCLGFLAVAPFGALRAHEFSLPSASVIVGEEVTVDLTLSADEVVQGFVAAADWDPSVAEGIEIVPGAALDGADTVVTSLAADHVVIAVVLDSDPADEGSPEELPVGDHVVASITLRGVAEGTTGLSFQDGAYASAEGGLLLDNTVVAAGGISVTVAEGLVLTNGSLDVAPDTGEVVTAFTAESIAAPAGATTVMTRVLLDSTAPVQGYTVALAHDAAVVNLTSAGIAGTDAEAAGAEFVDVEMSDAGVVVSVIFDIEEPFDNQTLMGEGLSIATLTYEVVNPPQVDPDPSTCPANNDPDVVATLSFVDGVLGTPAKDNVVVIDGLSMTPGALNEGTLTFTADACPVAPDAENTFACGGDLGDDGLPGSLGGAAGDTVPVSLYYTAESNVQGLQMAITYGAGLSCTGEFSTEGTATADAAAEFVNVDCEDGEAGGELIVGILVDADSPLDGATLPSTADLLKLVTVDFVVTDAAPCDASIAIDFTNGATGAGDVAINNVFSIDNQSVAAEALTGCAVAVEALATFVRGDCNFDMVVDIADAASVVSSLFMDDPFVPPCLSGCDANDDGAIDLGDAVAVLAYLFQFAAPPPAPGLMPGVDPTADGLSCDAGRSCP